MILTRADLEIEAKSLKKVCERQMRLITILPHTPFHPIPHGLCNIRYYTGVGPPPVKCRFRPQIILFHAGSKFYIILAFF